MSPLVHAKVLVGFDASDDAVQALHYAVAEALALNADLVIVYVADDTVLNSAWGVVFDPITIKDTAEELLREAVAGATQLGMPAERVSTTVELGSPAAALARLSHDATLVVVGRASSNARRSFAGSTAVGLAGACHCPLVIVADDGKLVTHGEGDIGVAVDSAGRGAKALAWALSYAAIRGNRVRVLSICRAPHSRLFSQRVTPEQVDQALRVTRERLDVLVEAPHRSHSEVEVVTEVGYGAPLDELVARTDDLEMLVVEVLRSFPTYTVGGVIRGIMAHAACPVVLVEGQ